MVRAFLFMYGSTGTFSHLEVGRLRFSVVANSIFDFLVQLEDLLYEFRGFEAKIVSMDFS